MNRDKISQREALKIINSQSNDINKEKLSDVVIQNDGNNEIWKIKINELI